MLSTGHHGYHSLLTHCSLTKGLKWRMYALPLHTHSACLPASAWYLLVAVVLQVLLVAVLLEQGIWVAARQPVRILHYRLCTLGLNLLPLPAPWHRGRQTYRSTRVTVTEALALGSIMSGVDTVRGRWENGLRCHSLPNGGVSGSLL